MRDNLRRCRGIVSSGDWLVSNCSAACIRSGLYLVASAASTRSLFLYMLHVTNMTAPLGEADVSGYDELPRMFVLCCMCMQGLYHCAACRQHDSGPERLMWVR
jgi:hypothetical protein